MTETVGAGLGERTAVRTGYRSGYFGDFLRDAGLGPDGRYPLNTHGGQLGFSPPDLAGGMTHVVEAVRQLRGDRFRMQPPRLSRATEPQ